MKTENKTDLCHSNWSNLAIISHSIHQEQFRFWNE
jgi:hypothetical protein